MWLLLGTLDGVAWAEDVEGRLDLIFAADLDGRFTPARCQGPPMDVGPGLAALAGAVALAREQAPTALAIGGAGLLGPGNVARFLLSDAAGSGDAAALLRRAGIEIFAPGAAEFEMEPEGFLSYLRELGRLGPAPLVSNLKCEKDRSLCAALVPQQIVSRNGVRVGLLNVLSEDLPRRVGPGHLRDGKILPPGSIADRVRAMRPQVDAIVILADLDTGLGAGGVIDLVRSLDGAGAHADVVLAARMDDRRSAVASVALSSGTLVVGAPSEGAGVAVVSLGIDRGGVQVHARRLLSGAPAKTVAAEVQGIFARMCQRWESPLVVVPGAGLPREAFVSVVLDAMRLAGHADVALINAHAIDDRGLPLRSASVAALSAAIPYPAQVVVGKVLGKDLGDVLGKYVVPESRVRLIGLTKKDDAFKVNGRTLDPVATYRVATLDFIANGGDGLVPPEFVKGPPVCHDLRLCVLSSFARAGVLPPPLPLSERPLWIGNLDLGVDLQSISVQNPQDRPYDRPQLSRQASLAFKLDSTARAQMDQPSHLLQVSLRAQYGGIQAAATAGKDPSWRETVDLVTFLALYSFRGLSAHFPLVPTPYSSLGLETEFDQPDTRTYHHLELSALFGAREAIVPKLSLVVGAGLRHELLASGDVPEQVPVARPRFLLSATLELLKRAVWPRLGDKLLGEANITYSYTDPAFLRSHELRATGKLYVALGRPLYVTLGADLYLYGDQGRDPGVSLDLSAGIKVVLDARRQTF